MPGHGVVYRERLLAVAAPGGPVYTHWLQMTARIDARAKELLSGQMVGVRTGNLRSSQAPPTIVFTGTRIRGILRNTAGYAAAIHEGSRPHDIVPVKARYLRFTPSGLNAAAGTGGGRTPTGGPIFRKLVHHPGTQPRPFLRRAAEEITGVTAIH